MATIIKKGRVAPEVPRKRVSNHESRLRSLATLFVETYLRFRTSFELQYLML